VRLALIDKEEVPVESINNELAPVGIKKNVVIGGGPAGVIAASYSAKNGNETILVEKNSKLLCKLLITGKGRCNITNNCDIEDFFKNIPVNSQFMYSALYSFTNDDIVNLLNQYGVETKVERGNRVFPVSDKAQTVATGLTSFAKECGVKVLLNSKVIKIEKKGDQFKIIIGSGKIIDHIDHLIIATGGMTYPMTGSTGDGYHFAEKMGHTIATIKGALVPLEVEEQFVKELVGLSLRNVGIKVRNEKNKVLYEDFGEMLFAHFGVTGPLIISASSHINDDVKNTLHIDLKPALSEKQLDERLIRDFAKFQNRDFINSLDELLPKSLIPVIAELTGIDLHKKCNAITKDERKKLLEILKNFTLTITKKRPVKDAIITSGGIKVSEINPSTMESKLVKGLYFCGEVIDVDGYTGGFNLQIAYSTGYLAGTST
jgi:hypothetical protein